MVSEWRKWRSVFYLEIWNDGDKRGEEPTKFMPELMPEKSSFCVRVVKHSLSLVGKRSSSFLPLTIDNTDLLYSFSSLTHIIQYHTNNRYTDCLMKRVNFFPEKEKDWQSLSNSFRERWWQKGEIYFSFSLLFQPCEMSILPSVCYGWEVKQVKNLLPSLPLLCANKREM